MQKTILITGATDGIGLVTAKLLVSKGHHVLLHGRNPVKLDAAEQAVSALPGGGKVGRYLADLSRIAEVEAFAKAVAEEHASLDALINNAGIFGPGSVTPDGLDVRFAVNTLAPYLLTQHLRPSLGPAGRVINLSSAAQAPVDLKALAGKVSLSDMEAYSQSKLALTMWSCRTGQTRKDTGPVVIAVNPGSLLGSKMVKEAFGVAGGDLRIGAEVLCRAALSDDFADASGRYFDNDAGQFARPHGDALDPEKCDAVMQAIESVLAAAVH